MKQADLQTPCFIFDRTALLTNARQFKAALDEFFPRNILSYSVKTNALPQILRDMADWGHHIEVVSADEYDLARACGAAPERLIYNGPLKDKRSFLAALHGGAYVNLENFREIAWLPATRPGAPAPKLGLRLTIDWNGLPGTAAAGESDLGSRFGFSDADGEFSRALDRLRVAGYTPRGLHVHRTSPTRSLDAYRYLIRRAAAVVRRYDLTLDYLDLGGGFYGQMPGKPDYRDYVAAIAEELRAEGLDTARLCVLVEPGNGLIASPVAFLTEVLDAKCIRGRRFCVIDGSRIDIDPLFHKKRYQYSLIKRQEERRPRLPAQVLSGCTCLENDRLTVLEGEEMLLPGDRLRFSAQGAYTMTLSPNFIRYWPRVYLTEDGRNYTLIRRAWTSTDLLCGDLPAEPATSRERK